MPRKEPRAVNFNSLMDYMGPDSSYRILWNLTVFIHCELSIADVDGGTTQSLEDEMQSWIQFLQTHV